MQNYTNYQYIIIDGASSDETINVIKSNLSIISIYQSSPDTGIYDALNKGIALADGDVIGFLHSDDIFSSNNVLSMIANAFEDSSVSATYGDLTYVKRQNISKIIRRWKSNKFRRDALNTGWMPPHPTLYVRREWYNNIGDFDTSFKISADYLSILKFFLNPNFKAHYIPFQLVTMRLGGVSTNSIGKLLIKTSEDWKALRMCKFGIWKSIHALLGKNIRKFNQFL